MLRFRRFAITLFTVFVTFFCGCITGAETVTNEVSPETEALSSGSTRTLSDLMTVVTKENCSDYDFTEKAMEYLTIIGEQYPNRSSSEDGTDNVHDEFGNWLLKELVACGYDPGQIEEQPFTGKSMFDTPVEGRNIILTVPGQMEGQIIVCAHYDGSGLGDNGSGVALLLATAAGLVDASPQYTIKYIFFDGEEEGKVGSRHYAGQMSEEDVVSTLYLINCDALVFGDFCNIYGGAYGDEYDVDFLAFVEGEVIQEPRIREREGYDFAADIAEQLGFRVYRTEDLEGYYEKNGHGMEPQEDAFFTNPWTYAHPAPKNKEAVAPSPATMGGSDQAPFAERGIPYIYFEAANWWAEGTDPNTAYVGYNETYDESKGVGGQFMNTDYDTLENLIRFFPHRAENHYRMYSPLLSALLFTTPGNRGDQEQ